MYQVLRYVSKLLFIGKHIALNVYIKNQKGKNWWSKIIKITSTGEKNKGRIINEITRRECLMKYKINKQ